MNDDNTIEISFFKNTNEENVLTNVEALTICGLVNVQRLTD
jgi:hypothetical protein